MAKPKSLMTRAVNTTSTNNQVPSDYRLTVLDEHIKDNNIHVDQNLRDGLNYAREDIESHSSNEDIHVSKEEKAIWNAKETVNGAQSKANKVKSLLDSHINNRVVHLTQNEKNILKDKYTKAETRNLLKHALSGLIFLPAVYTRAELELKYPNPKINSCVSVRSEKMQFIYNGTSWVDINLLLTPEVTSEYDGLMTNEDKVKLDSIEDNANNYIHPDDIDTKHVSVAQIDYWNNKADNKFATVIDDGLMKKEDKIKLDSIEDNANNYIHPETHDPSIIIQDEDNRFVTNKQIEYWDNKTNKDYVDETLNNFLATAKAFTESKVSSIFNANEEQLRVLRSLSFELKNDETVKKFFDLFNSCIQTEEFNDHILNDKIHMSRNDISLLRNVKDMLAEGLNPDMEETDTTSPAYIKNKPKSLPANGGNADTVGGYGTEDLLNNRSLYDFTIGTAEYNDNQVSIKTTDDNVVEKIDTIFGLLCDDYCKSSVLFKPGYYKLNKEFVIRASNKVISGIGDISRLLGVSIKIIGDNNIIQNICFTNISDTLVNKTAIIVEGNNNIITNNTIRKYDKGISIEGSYNKVLNNTIIGVRNEAIEVLSDLNANYGNIIENNNITYSKLGIVLNSTNILSKNHISKNNIDSVDIGIILSNREHNTSKTTLNIISENIITKGNGANPQYLPTQKTIISEFASGNIISNNITLGKEIVSSNDVLSNNIF